jgi:hypothetical protein
MERRYLVGSLLHSLFGRCIHEFLHGIILLRTILCDIGLDSSFNKKTEPIMDV